MPRRYKTRLCIYGDKCPYGPGRCFFAHEEAELRPPQARWWLPEYKTKPCRYAISECPFYADGRCQYAHTVAELQYARPPPRAAQDKKYKTRMCRYGAGTCPYGVSCSYAHSPAELRPVGPEDDFRQTNPPGEPSDVVSRLERLRALRDSGSLSPTEFEELKRQVLNEPEAFAAEPPALLAPSSVPQQPRRLSPPPADAYMLPAMPMPPPASAPARRPRPPGWHGAPPLRPAPCGYAPPRPYAGLPRPPGPGYAYPAPAPRGCGYGNARPRPPGYAYGAPPPRPYPAGPYAPPQYPMPLRPRPPFDPRRMPRQDGSPGHEGGSPRPAF